MSEAIHVFVVDDEQPVIDGITAVINNQLSGYRVVGSALNGRDALSALRQHAADVVLVDIHMPGIDGIDLIRQMRETSMNSVCILITAYERFDVARRAFGLDVLAYLLKPVSPRRLSETLSLARAEVEQRRNRSENVLTLRSELDALLPILERGFLAMLLRGSTGTELKLAAERLGIADQKLAPLVLRLYRSNRLETAGKLLSIVLDSLRYAAPLVAGAPEHNSVHLLVPGTRNNRGELVDMVRRSCEKGGLGLIVEDAAATETRNPAGATGTRLLVAAADAAPLAELPSRFEELTASIVSAGTAVPAAEQNGVRQEAYRHVQRGRSEAARECLFHYLEHAPAGEKRQACLRFFLPLAERFDSATGAHTVDRGEEDGWIRDAASLEELLNRAGRRLLYYCEQFSHQSRLPRLVRETLSYIDEHLDEPITLESTALQNGVTAQHLSRTFAAELGQSFVDYVTETRITRARELLLRPGHSVKEVAYLSGYTDPNYFGRVFKKISGVTPGEYQRSHGSVV